MLFPYAYVSHGMERMQSFIDHVFHHVWCAAPGAEYSIDLFSGMPELYAVMDVLDREDKAGVDKGAGAYFYRHVNSIFNQFKALSPQEVEAYRDMYERNNDIESLCVGEKNPVRYAEGPGGPLWEEIESFFSKLYRSGFVGLSMVKKAIGTDLRTHYKQLMKENRPPSCPFCGLLPIDTEHDPTRDAYDHYLPCSKYPFNSVNLKNLAPACGKCNSGNKGDSDPLAAADGTSRKAFYPYSAAKYAISIQVDIASHRWNGIEPEEMSIALACEGHDQEVETWDALYRVRQRYAAKTSSPSGAAHWVNRVLNEHMNYGRSVREMLEAELSTAGNAPWIEANFLRCAVLEGFDRAGLFDA
jgi:hypothetical protein